MLWIESVLSPGLSRLLLRVVALVAVSTFTAGANSCGTKATDPRFVTDLVLKNAAAEARDEFARGEPITFELTVRNRGDEETVLQFASGRQYEFVVVDAGTRNVRWKWSSERLLALWTPEIVFAPRETKTFTAEGTQVDDNGEVLSPGSYEARGVLLFQEFEDDPLAPHQLGSPLKTLRIN